MNPLAVLLSVIILVAGCEWPISTSAVQSGIAILALRNSAAISASAADDIMFFVIVVGYKIEPLIILSSLLPK